MRKKRKVHTEKQLIATAKKNGRNVLFVFFLICLPAFLNSPSEAGSGGDGLEITPNFAGREIAPDEKIELRLSRPLKPGEGSLAVFLGETDLTALLTVEPTNLIYLPQIIPLPTGDNPLTIYLVTPAGEWKKLAEFLLHVSTNGPNPAETPQSPSGVADAEQVSGEGWKMEFNPGVVLNLKSQNQTLTFPPDTEPERNPSTDLDGQGNFELKILRRGWAFSNRFDLIGVSFRSNALRFGELGNRAPLIDLSSYLIELTKGRFRVRMGHLSVGSSRHLINGFSSRGITVTVPLGRQNEISLAALNGTSIVGFDNFTGILHRRHNVLSATFAREFFRERPGGLRVEASVISGSLLPLSNFNQGEINDAEKSLGFSFRVTGSDSKGRLRFEGDFTRSRFTNPADSFLEQGLTVTGTRPVTRNARYGEISFDFLQGLKLWKEKKLRLTGTFRHEEIAPLFRSVAAFTQADRRQNQFEITGTFGEINFGYGNLRDRDNLNGIPSILKTLNRHHNFLLGIPLNSFFTPDKPGRWLPMVSYRFDKIHQFGAFLPVNGNFRDPSQVPDQQSFVQTINGQWQLNDRFAFGYSYNRAFQDNRQTGRERADFASAVSSLTFGIKLNEDLNLDLDLNFERQKNFEELRIDRTIRSGLRTNWRNPFLKNSNLSAGFSTTVAGDTGNLNNARSIEFETQWAYNFSFGENKFKKMSGQFFIRYANRYGDSIDRQFFFSSINKAQTFNFGLTLNLF